MIHQKQAPVPPTTSRTLAPIFRRWTTPSLSPRSPVFASDVVATSYAAYHPEAVQNFVFEAAEQLSTFSIGSSGNAAPTSQRQRLNHTEQLRLANVLMELFYRQQHLLRPASENSSSSSSSSSRSRQRRQAIGVKESCSNFLNLLCDEYS